MNRQDLVALPFMKAASWEDFQILVICKLFFQFFFGIMLTMMALATLRC